VIGPLLTGAANTIGLEYILQINTTSKNDATTRTTALLGIVMGGVEYVVIKDFWKIMIGKN
jgi:hypothetical protein